MAKSLRSIGSPEEGENVDRGKFLALCAIRDLVVREQGSKRLSWSQFFGCGGI